MRYLSIYSKHYNKYLNDPKFSEILPDRSVIHGKEMP